MTTPLPMMMPLILFLGEDQEKAGIWPPILVKIVK
jgi:hypothetical protein